MALCTNKVVAVCVPLVALEVDQVTKHRVNGIVVMSADDFLNLKSTEEEDKVQLLVCKIYKW